MSQVTGLAQKRNTLRVFLDGRLSLTLNVGVAARQDLCLGQELTEVQVARLAEANQLCKCLASASRHLGYRPHSEHELRTKLARRYPSGTIDGVITRLKEQGLVDDASFCEYWSRSRQSSNPRSQGLIRVELRRKGVKTDLVKDLVKSDDAENAYRAALGRVGWLGEDEKSRRRLADYLRRRGFTYEVINQTVKRVVKEQTGTSQEMKYKV